MTDRHALVEQPANEGVDGLCLGGDDFPQGRQGRETVGRGPGEGLTDVEQLRTAEPSGNVVQPSPTGASFTASPPPE